MAQIRMLAEAQTPSTVIQLGRAELDTTETCSQQWSPALNPAVKRGGGAGREGVITPALQSVTSRSGANDSGGSEKR